MKTKDTAETYYVEHPEASYGIFCFNSLGDLFLNSDWGFYGYAWRSYGTDFKEFLKGTNADYIVSKFAVNYNQDRAFKDRFKGRKEECVKLLVETFLKELSKP